MITSIVLAFLVKFYFQYQEKIYRLFSKTLAPQEERN